MCFLCFARPVDHLPRRRSLPLPRSWDFSLWLALDRLQTDELDKLQTSTLKHHQPTNPRDPNLDSRHNTFHPSIHSTSSTPHHSLFALPCRYSLLDKSHPVCLSPTPRFHMLSTTPHLSCRFLERGMSVAIRLSRPKLTTRPPGVPRCSSGPLTSSSTVYSPVRFGSCYPTFIHRADRACYIPIEAQELHHTFEL